MNQKMSRGCGFWLALWLSLLTTAGLAADDTDYRKQRLALIGLIEQDVADTSRYLDKDALDPRVMTAMGKVPRHRFVPEDLHAAAYENRPLPIGYGQTISQPYIVAIMTDMLKPQPDDVVLELGTGSGYQAAVLAELVQRVYTVEIIAPLGQQAKARLEALGYENIEARIGDGYHGWPEHGPFDAIVVTAAASHIPPPLIKQLRPGARMVIPVGSRFMTQQLLLVEKAEDGQVITRQVLPVRFVPLTGGHD